MAASEGKLGKLHEAVADALAEQVKGYEETVKGEDGKEETKFVRPSPSLLTAAITFLKNNNITADPEQNEALTKLSQTLRDKRKGKINAAALDEAADDYARSAGGYPVQ